jgi:hypothetical protein
MERETDREIKGDRDTEQRHIVCICVYPRGYVCRDMCVCVCVCVCVYVCRLSTLPLGKTILPSRSGTGEG